MLNKIFKFGFFYKTSIMELKFFKKYLNKMLVKSYIYKSKLFASSLIIFVLKLDGKKKWTFWFYINFQKFNIITVKNKYPISNIQELRDWLKGVK